MEAEEKLIAAMEAEEQWGMVEGVKLATIRSNRTEMIARLKMRRLPAEERKKLKTKKERLSKKITDCVKERKELEKKMKKKEQHGRTSRRNTVKCGRTQRHFFV